MTDEDRSLLGASSTLFFAEAVLVTEEMIIHSRAGDLEQLKMWARQGVRVTTGEPLCAAVWSGDVQVLYAWYRSLVLTLIRPFKMGRHP
jgi:hypothetical protein